jgi:hypothetical protein
LLAGYGKRIEHTLAEGLSTVGQSTQVAENKAVIETDKPSSESQKQKLAPSLFLDSEIDPDLKTVIEHWQRLSVELRQAIVKMTR